MKPKPFASLNHFTVPVVRISENSWCCCVVGVAEHAVRTDPQLLVITLTTGALSMLLSAHRRLYGLKKRPCDLRRPLDQHRNVFARLHVRRSTNVRGSGGSRNAKPCRAGLSVAGACG